MKNTPPQLKNGRLLYVLLFSTLQVGHSLVATELFQSGTDRTGDRLQGVPAIKYCFQLVPINKPLDEQKNKKIK